MNADAVLEQIEKLSPEERGKLLDRLKMREVAAPSADFAELIADGVIRNEDGIWVIAADIEGGLPEDLVFRERERRIKELTDESR